MACCGGHGLSLWDWPAAKPREVNFDGGGLALAADCSADAGTLVTVHEDGGVKVWAGIGGPPVKVLQGHRQTPVGVASDGRNLCNRYGHMDSACEAVASARWSVN